MANKQKKQSPKASGNRPAKKSGAKPGEKSRANPGANSGARPAKNPTGVPPDEAEIIRYMDQQDGPITRRDIARAFGVRGAGRAELRHMLKDMADRGVINLDKAKKPVAKGKLPPVTVLEVVGSDDDGDLIARPVKAPDGMEQARVYLPHGGDALGPGDRVLAKLSPIANEDPPAWAAKVIRKLDSKPPETEVIGIFEKVGKAGRLRQTSKKGPELFAIAAEHAGDAKDGDLCVAVTLPGKAFGLKTARIIRRINSMDESDSFSLIAIHEQGIPVEFSQDVLAEVDAISELKDFKGLADLRDIPLVTIDPADARDHDDAVWAGPDDDPTNRGGHQVIVAIADVAHYVKPGTALDEAARERGNSSYFPDRVVPMLPDRLSGDLCSLHEHVDRPCLAVRMTFDVDGRKIKHKFLRGVMRSHASLTYQDAQSAFDGAPSRAAEPLAESVLMPLWEAYQAVAEARDKREPLDLDMPEHRINLDDQGKVTHIALRERLEAHRLIEEFMVLANVCAAEELEKRKAPPLYRVHDTPSDEKILALTSYLHAIDINFARGQVIKPIQFNQILRNARGTPFEFALPDMVLRSQSQAIYSPDNLGHFGLNLRRYSHFTSPIRRYADLITHRALIAACKLAGGGGEIPDTDWLAETADHISKTERRSMAAERDTTDRYLASYLTHQEKNDYTGRIAGLSRAGLFVRLDGIGADGLLPMRSLPRDSYDLNEREATLTGYYDGRVFRVGDPIEVEVKEAAPLRGGILLGFIDHTPLAAPKPKRGSGARRSGQDKAKTGKRSARKGQTKPPRGKRRRKN